MSIGVGVAYAAAITAAGAILAAESENALLNGGAYIRDGQPKDFTGKVGQQIARRACLAYANDPASVRGAEAIKFENACRPYLDSQGAGTGLSGGTGFLGGQCNVRYNISIPASAYAYRVIVCSTGVVEFDGAPIDRSVGNIKGPIRRIWPKPISNGACGVNGIVWTVVDADGIETPFGQTTVASTRRLEFYRYSPILTRVDGQPDNCGDPPPVLIDPTPDPTPTPIRQPIVIAPDVYIDASVSVTAIGQVVVDLGLGPVTIDPFAEPDPQPGGGGLGPDEPGDIGSPATAISTGVGGDAEGEAPPGSVLTGLELTLETIPLYAREYATGVFRGACYVYMGVPGKLDQDFAGALLRDGQFVFAELDFLTAWRVVANPGYNIRVTPFYREVQ